MNAQPRTLLADILPPGDAPNPTTARERVEIVKLQFEYAWRAWQYNAQQRLQVFNFALLLSGAAASLLGVLLGDRHFVGAAVLGGLAACLLVVFYFLDHRNDELVRDAEDLLRTLETEALFVGASFEPKQRPRRWPLGMQAERLPEGTSLPLGLRRRVDAEDALRARRLDDARGTERIVDRGRRILRRMLFIRNDGRSPYRFGHWLSLVLLVIGFGFTAAAVVSIALALNPGLVEASSRAANAARWPA